jgi:NAD-dependent DNA ligase
MNKMLLPSQKNLAIYFQAKQAYYSGEPIMSDIDFDQLEVFLAKTNPEIMKHVGASDRTGKEKLPLMMGSLDQIKNQKELSAWMSRFPKADKYVFTEKIDGNSNLLQYKSGILLNSFSRGDGVQGASNIRHTQKMQLPQYIPTGFNGFVRGELAIAKADWANLLAESAREYANARNFVAGFMNKTEGQAELYKYFRFIAFELFAEDMEPISKGYQMEVLASAGFKTPRRYTYFPQFSYSDAELIIEEMILGSEFEIDGVVLDVDSKEYREFSPTADDLNPPYAVKIKLVSDGVESEVLGVEWSVSKDGLLKPVVLIKPIQLTGVTISRVTGYNAKFIVDNQIGVGAVVQVVRSGDVIPKIVGVTWEADEVILPPGIWNKSNVDLISTTDDGNLDMKAKQMEYFFSKMEIDFIGEGAVAKLFDAGVTEVIWIINNPSPLEQVIGENGRKAAVIMKKILSETTPQRLFAALGVFGRGLGERKLKVVFDKYPVEMVLSSKIKLEEYCELPGYDVTSATLLIENWPLARTVYDLIKGSVKFVKPKAIVLGEGAFSNQILVATGVRLSPELIAKVQAQGGIVSDSFGKTTTILVAKDPQSTSGKMGKAKEMGIKVISLATLMEMV